MIIQVFTDTFLADLNEFNEFSDFIKIKINSRKSIHKDFRISMVRGRGIFSKVLTCEEFT